MIYSNREYDWNLRAGADMLKEEKICFSTTTNRLTLITHMNHVCSCVVAWECDESQGGVAS